MKTPAAVYAASPRPFAGLPELAYPFHDRDSSSPATAPSASTAARSSSPPSFDGQRLGLREVDIDVWLVSFMHYDLGYIDLEARDPANHRHPVRLEGVTYVIGTNCYPCARTGQRAPTWPEKWLTRKIFLT